MDRKIENYKFCRFRKSNLSANILFMSTLLLGSQQMESSGPSPLLGTGEVVQSAVSSAGSHR